MPTPAHRRARQRACLAAVVILLLAGGIALLMLPLKFPFPVRALLAAGDLVVAMTLLALLRQNPPPP